MIDIASSPPMSATEPELHRKTETNKLEDCDWFLCCFEVFSVNFFSDQQHQNELNRQAETSTQNKLRESLKDKLTTLFRNKKIKQQQNNRKSTRLRSLRCESSETYTPHEKASMAVFRSHSMSLLRRSIDFEEKYHVPSGPLIFAGMNSMQTKLGLDFATMAETPAVGSGGLSVATPFSQQLSRNNSGDNSKQLSTTLRGENRLSSLSKACRDALSRVRRVDMASRLVARGMVVSPEVTGDHSNSGDLRGADNLHGGVLLNASSTDSNRSATERALCVSPPSTPRSRRRNDLERLCDISTSYSEVLQLQNINDDAILHCICVLMAADSFSLTARESSLEEEEASGEGDATETDDVAPTPTPPVSAPQRRLSASTQKSRSGSQNTSASNSISSAEEVLGTMAPGSVNGAVNAMLSSVWTRHSQQRVQTEDFAEGELGRSNSSESVTSLSITHPARIESPAPSRPEHFTCVDVDRWLRPRGGEPLVVRVAANCLHRLSSLLRSAGKDTLPEARLCAQTCIQLLQTARKTEKSGCAVEADADCHRLLELASAYSLLCRILDELGLVGDAHVADRKARDSFATAAAAVTVASSSSSSKEGRVEKN